VTEEKKPLEKIYGAKFFRGRHKYHWRAPIVCACVQYMFPETKSVIDVGCATGDLVKGFMDLGLDAWGLEGDPSCVPYLVCPERRVLIHDLREPLAVADPRWRDMRLDLVTCWEVLEHVEPEHVDVLVQNLVDLSDRLLLSACPPSTRKGGSVHHVNEQPPEYWVEKFGAHGYKRGPKREQIFRAVTQPWRHKYGIKAFWENVIYFEKAV
jgi:hypothetical protein